MDNFKNKIVNGFNKLKPTTPKEINIIAKIKKDCDKISSLCDKKKPSEETILRVLITLIGNLSKLVIISTSSSLLVIGVCSILISVTIPMILFILSHNELIRCSPDKKDAFKAAILTELSKAESQAKKMDDNKLTMQLRELKLKVNEVFKGV